MYQLKNLSLSYKLNSDNYLSILNNINLEFPSKGMVFIVGKSGSGKTSLLNILEGLIKPTEGEIFYKSKNLKEFSNREKRYYFKNEIGILFQNMNLISDITVKENLELSSSIKGNKTKECFQLLKDLNIDSLLNQKVNLLSGGEKQRVAFIRAIANKPSVLLCDEPTGAIDEENSLILINLLRKYALNNLVIVVTHSIDLIKSEDVVFEIENGNIKTKNNFNNIFKDTDINKNKINNKKFINIMQKRVFKTNKLKNILFTISVSFSILFSLLSVGFYYGIDNLKNDLQYNFINANFFKVSNKIISDQGNSPLQIIQKERPSFESLFNNLSYILSDFILEYNFDYFKTGKVEIWFNNQKINNVNLDFYFDKNINAPLIVNKLFYENYAFKKENSIKIELSKDYKYSRLFENEYKEVVETFFFNDTFNIVNNYYDEFKYLNYPTIYINLFYFKDYLSTIYCTEINNIFNTNYTWIDLIKNSKNNEDLGGFCLNLIVFSKKDIRTVCKYIDKLSVENSNLDISSQTYIISKSFLELTNLLTFGLIIFSIISLITTSSLLFFIVTSLCLKERKEVAIMLVLGARKNHIINIYVKNFLLNTTVSLLLSITLYLLIQKIINNVIYNKLSINVILV